jgi:hypothetical protein
LFVHGELGNQLGDVLRGKKLAAGFARVGGVVGNKKFVCIAEQVDMGASKSPNSRPATPFSTSAKRLFLSLTVLPKRLLVVSKSAKRPLMSCSEG